MWKGVPVSLLVDTTPIPGAVRPAAPGVSSPKAAALFAAYEQAVFDRANRLFLRLLPAQWICAVMAALWLHRSQTMLVGALLAGALCSVPAMALMRERPHVFSTRAFVALSQAGFSLIFMGLSAGQIEMDFHVFGSLAFLALYRDWRILPLAGLAAVIHPLVASHPWPIGGMDPAEGSFSHTIGFSGWIAFEAMALCWLCVISRRDMREICEQQEQNQSLLDDLERRVRERTRALESAAAEREKTAAALQRSEQHHRELVARR